MKENMIMHNPENIGDELFNSFDPEEELWLIGGSGRRTDSLIHTASPSGGDINTDYDIEW